MIYDQIEKDIKNNSLIERLEYVDADGEVKDLERTESGISLSYGLKGTTDVLGDFRCGIESIVSGDLNKDKIDDKLIFCRFGIGASNEGYFYLIYLGELDGNYKFLGTFDAGASMLPQLEVDYIEEGKVVCTYFYVNNDGSTSMEGRAGQSGTSETRKYRLNGRTLSRIY